MITIDHAEIARHRLAERLRVTEHDAVRRDLRRTRRAARSSGARQRMAGALRRLADRLEPRQRQNRPSLSVVR